MFSRACNVSTAVIGKDSKFVKKKKHESTLLILHSVLNEEHFAQQSLFQPNRCHHLKKKKI